MSNIMSRRAAISTAVAAIAIATLSPSDHAFAAKGPKKWEKTPVEKIIKKFKRKGSSYDQVITLTGPKIYQGSMKSSVEYWFRAFVSKDTKRAIGYQIYARVEYSGDWRYYTQATDDQSTPFAVRELDSEVASCNEYYCRMVEHLGIEVRQGRFFAGQMVGIKMRLKSRRGDEEFLHVPVNYVKAMHQMIEAEAN